MTFRKIKWPKYEESSDPSFCPLQTPSPILERPTCSGPGGRCPPGQWRPRAARRIVGGRHRLEGFVPRDRGLSFARATFISPRTTVTPLSYIPKPCNGRNGPKGLQSNKPNQNLRSMSAYLATFTAHLYFGLGRRPITPPGPAMVRSDRKDLN